MKLSHFTLLFFTVVCFLACRKEDSLNTDSSEKLEFSTDTLSFDTVFTSTGSTTQRIKVFNRGKRAVKIQEIKLGGGASSNYQININGLATPYLEGVEIRGNDSLNIFVKVTINPDSQLLPFIVKDSIGFVTNGNYQKVILSAYGQNAVFLKDASINTNTVWDNRLPYVIYNKVTINPEKVLTIQRGAKVYFHKDAELIIAGTLKVNGAPHDSVIFSSDRFERIYADEPGQWKGLHFLEGSKDNLINYALIENGTVGIQVDSLSENADPKLLLVNTMIYNMELVGLYGNNADIAAFNNVIANCGKYLIYGINGGRYDFKQNTLANISFQFPRTTPSLFFTDQASQTNTSPFSLTLVNNIIWGSLQDELVVEKKGVLAFTQSILKNLIKSRDRGLESFGNILNIDPQFKNARQNNYLLNPASPAINKGKDLTNERYFSSWLNKDLNDKIRLFPSDLGSYEIL